MRVDNAEHEHVQQQIMPVHVNSVVSSSSKNAFEKKQSAKTSVEPDHVSLQDITTRFTECMKCGRSTSLKDKQIQTDESDVDSKVSVEVQTFITGLQKYKTYKELEYLKEIKHGGFEFKKQKQD